MKYGYIRVSSKEQDESRQMNAMLDKNIEKKNIFIDKSSGKTIIGREEWNKLLAKIVIGDVIVIKELDRLGRNNAEIKDTFQLIKDKGCFLEFIEQPLLNTSQKSDIERELVQPLILHLLGYFAEKERIKIKNRQKEAYNSLETDVKGRKVSRKKNKVVGRPNKIENLSSEEKRFINAWMTKQIKLSDCIKSTGLSQATLYRVKREVALQNKGEINHD